MALVDVRGFNLNPVRDISPLTDALQQALTGRREQQETLRLEGIQTQQRAFKTTGAQFLRLRNLNNLTTQKTELAKLAQAALKRGEDITAHQEGLNINNQDEMNLFLTRIATRAADADKLLNEGLARQKPVGGLASAKTEILPGGATIQVQPDSSVKVTNALGEEVEGQARIDVIERAAKIKADAERATQDLRVETERSIQQVKDAESRSNKAFETVDKIRQNIINLEQVVPLIGEGASTGPISRLFPSVRAATIKLEQLQKRLSLDVVGAVTFGALSKGELDLAKAVAIPLGLEGDELIQWTNETISAKRKLATYYEDQAIFLSNGGTQAGWLEKQRAELAGLLSRAGATEADISQTMKDNNMSRPQVLDELKRRFPGGS